MTRRSGSADLPLHYGRVPPWLAERMAKLGSVICEAIIQDYGRDELLRRLAHPFWFQSFGAIMGMDWHSSGITTSVIGALKRGLTPLAGELGLHVCGGRGNQSRRTPAELAQIGAKVGFDGAALAEASRLVAKVDSAAVQDGFDLYLHGFFVTDDGRWTVVQQGMNGDGGLARRYHWHSEGLGSFVEAPHSAIEGQSAGDIVNLTDARASRARESQIAMLREQGPDGIVRELAALRPERSSADQDSPQLSLPHLVMPAHHEVRSKDVLTRRLHGALAAAADRGPADFAELLLVPGIGARTVRSLAMVAEVLHGAPCRFSDPARFSLAHGGKDRQPFAVPTKVYDQTIKVLRAAVDRARLGQGDRLAAIARLDGESRRLEQSAQGPTFVEYVAEERRRSAEYGGRSIFGWERPEAGGASFSRERAPPDRKGADRRTLFDRGGTP